MVLPSKVRVDRRGLCNHSFHCVKRGQLQHGILLRPDRRKGHVLDIICVILLSEIHFPTNSVCVLIPISLAMDYAVAP